MIRLIIYSILMLLTEGVEVPITCVKEGDLALTFDGGPSMHTGQLLGILAKHGVKASFHFTPENFDNPVIQAYVKRAAADGHLLGLYINDAKYAQKEIDRGRTALHRYAARTLKFVRVPMPLPEERILKAITSQGLVITSFNFDSMDYLVANRSVLEAQGSVFWTFKEMFDAIEPPAKGAFISVQRDMVHASVAATENIITYAKRRGYNFVRLDECIQSMPAPNVQEADDEDKKAKQPAVPIHPKEANQGISIKLDIAVILVACLIVLLEM